MQAAHGRTFSLRDGRQHPKMHVFRRIRQAPIDGEGMRPIALDQPPVSIDLDDGRVTDGGGRTDAGAVPGRNRQRKRPMEHAAGATLADSIEVDSEPPPKPSDRRRGALEAAGPSAGTARGGRMTTIELSDDDDDDDGLRQAIRASLQATSGAAGGSGGRGRGADSSVIVVD